MRPTFPILPALVIFGLLSGSPVRSRRTQERSPVHPSSILTLVSALLTGPSASLKHLFSVRDHGRQRSDRGPQHTYLTLRWPDCTLSRFRAEECDRPVTQSIATHRSRLRGRFPPWIGRWSPAEPLDVSPHPGSDSLVQGELPPITPEF